MERRAKLAVPCYVNVMKEAMMNAKILRLVAAFLLGSFVMLLVLLAGEGQQASAAPYGIQCVNLTGTGCGAGCAGC